MNALQQIDQTLKTKAVIGRLTMALGYGSDDEAGKQEAFRYAASVLAEVEKSAGDPKKDLTKCEPNSIAQTMIDAARFKLMIDGRQLAHIVAYGGKATLQIGFRGYLAKISEHFPDAQVIVEPIFEGDELEIWDENGISNYKLQKGSAFNDGEKAFKGILFVVTYTDKGQFRRRVNTVAKSRIDRARAAAKQKFIWESDYIEKAKAAAIKASCKHLFASIQGVQEMARYDNGAHFVLEASPDAPKSGGSIIANLNQRLATGQPAPKEGVQEAEVVEDAGPDADVVEPEPEFEDIDFPKPTLEIILASGPARQFPDFDEMWRWLSGNIVAIKTAQKLKEFSNRNAENFRLYRELSEDWMDKIEEIIRQREKELSNAAA